MPLSDLISKEMEDLELERAVAFRELWKLYDGEHPESLPVVKGAEGRPDTNDNVMYNLSRLTVDKGVSFLFGGIDQEVRFGLEDEGESTDEAWLEQVWDSNGRKTLLGNVATNGGVCGHLFVRLYEDGAKLDPLLPRLVNLDPATVLPIYADDDYEIVLGYKVQSVIERLGQKAVRRTLIEPNGIDVADLAADPREAQSWLVTDQIAIGEGDFLTMGEPEVWDYPFAPIVDAQNLPAPNEFWGASDLDGGVEALNYAINRSLSSMQRILRLHGHPKPYASGVTPEQIAILIQGVDRIITLPENVKLDQLEVSAEGMTAGIEYFRQLKAAFHDMAKNPQVDPEKLGAIGGLSGVALRILHQPLLEQTGTKHGTYGDFLVDVNRRLLQLGRREPRTVEISWPDPIPLAFKETAEGLALAREMGLSQETALEELGFNPQMEAERRAADTVPLGQGLDGVLDSAGFNSGAGQ